ncbi:MAG: nicotinate (nicotinamide) nucleotide adenylyltransferase [Rikenellaceae bacterium]
MGNKVILYFGSFNPIHNGHLSIAAYVLDRALCDEVWFIVSPQNPLKGQVDMLPESERFEMAQLAAAEWSSAIKVLDVEFTMSRPSYTIRTILRLEELYPDKNFSLLMGEDNILFFDRWRKWEEIVKHCPVLIYPRGAVQQRNVVEDKICELRQEGELKADRFIYLADAPRIHLSSTELRRQIDRIDGLTARSVVNYIKEKKLYDRK